MRRFYPLRCWPAVGGDQSGVNAVAMKFPAGIIVDALQAEIDALEPSAPGDADGLESAPARNSKPRLRLLRRRFLDARWGACEP